MGRLMNIITPLHTATAREYLPRMMDDKAACMVVAKQYEKDYWDGDRRYGYGGYRFMPGRWKPVAEALIREYGLTDGSRLLDVGCGKAYLLYELKQLLPGLVIKGFDISKHGLAEALPEVRDDLFIHDAREPFPFEDNEFDLVISLTTLFNLELPELADALDEIERVGKESFITVESYRNEQELFNLQCWALTCESFFSKREWEWLFDHFGFTGDYEFIYFE
ncbi:class I SAM-dependent methyltransferase [Pseudodesulfovibrio portus]|uniref:SAM-dependent methyltransferase n=1 Tax=Pseudodesulfovibrio portus TaxID=231439 RepID=A0ABN6RQ69_9BACT|nr:class I SAM-dependent methyltransferase [Pseudodesulfovibrio portus]BDQ32989.1 SAM-dependent methyltransferase [Pseudodesulfovibrio portus]